MAAKVAYGDFGDSCSWQDLYGGPDALFPSPPHVRSVLWNSDEPTATNPLTWEDWVSDGQRMFDLATKALDKSFTPEWEMISFRQEKATHSRDEKTECREPRPCDHDGNPAGPARHQQPAIGNLIFIIYCTCT